MFKRITIGLIILVCTILIIPSFINLNVLAKPYLEKYSHAIDPRLGKPVFHNVLSMTVLANTCAEADAFATAFLVMGLEKAKHFATKEKIDFFAIFEQNGQIETFSTVGMKGVILENN